MYLNQIINEENIDENLSSSESKMEFPNINSNTENNHGKIDEDNNHHFEYMRRANEKKKTKTFLFLLMKMNLINRMMIFQATIKFRTSKYYKILIQII